MSDTQWRRVGEIEGYKQKTFYLSRTDRIGRVITKSFELMQMIIRDGPNAETLIYDVESLKTEQANALKWDSNQSDLFRSILYDLSSSLGSMIESIQERNVTENSRENYVTATEFPEEDSSTYQGFMSEFHVKTEPIDPQEERLFTMFDLKPNGICDTVSPNVEEDVVIVENTAMDVTMDRSDTVNVNVNAEADSSGTSDPKISQSSRKRPRSVIVPKVNYEEEGEDSDEGTAAAPTSTTPGAGNVKCDHCERWFNSLMGLKRHMMMVHEGILCGDCGKRLKTADNLHRHYAEFHPGKRAKAAKDQSIAYSSLKCTVCEYTASDYSNLTRHMRKHTGEKPFSCCKCATKFSDNQALHRHLRIAHGEKPFECEDCGMKFGRYAEKFQHKKTKHRH